MVIKIKDLIFFDRVLLKCSKIAQVLYIKWSDEVRLLLGNYATEKCRGPSERTKI